MIYELALVAKPEATEEQLASLKDLVADVAKNYDGEVLLTDDWGKKNFAQTAKNGNTTGHYIYFIYKANNVANTELARRFKINELVHKSLTVKLGDANANAEEIVKAYKTPYSKAHTGSQTDELEKGADKDKRKFARRNTCWFKANSVTADWKDPKTYNWLINEFGKISPARVTGVSRKHHRFAEAAIKRARNIGLVSHLAGRFAE
jgi:small subunit ribosomal protein S6